MVLWAEEMLIEVNLVLDILFLLYYESFSTCSATKWKALCLLYKVHSFLVLLLLSVYDVQKFVVPFFFYLPDIVAGYDNWVLKLC